VLGFEVLVLRFMFRGAWFPIGRNKCWVAIKTQHVSISVCSRALVAHAWKPMLGRLEASDSFMTCH